MYSGFAAELFASADGLLRSPPLSSSVRDIMNKYILPFLLFILLFLNPTYSQNQKRPSAPLSAKVGYVSKANEIDGCGCSFYWPGDEKKENPKSIFSSDYGNVVWMNINGKDSRLKRIKSTESEKNNKKGDRYYEIYQSGKMMIRINYLVTWTCESDDPESESCEVTYYDLDITISQNGQQKRIKAKGICGC